MIVKLAEQANANLTLLNRGRRLTIDILGGVGADDFLVSIEKGRVVDVRRRRLAMESGVFIVRASAEAWKEHWKPMPARNFHDLLSMIAAGHAAVDGDLTPLLQNLISNFCSRHCGARLPFPFPRIALGVPDLRLPPALSMNPSLGATSTCP